MSCAPNAEAAPSAKGRTKPNKPDKPAQPKAPPFSVAEVELLSDQISEFKHILENKTSDAVMWSEKKSAWEKIAISFTQNGFTRTPEQLLNKWNALKKKSRSEFAAERRSFRKTGGGTADESQSVSAISQKVSAICSSYSIHGGSNLADCDADAFPGARGRFNDENVNPLHEEDADIPDDIEDVACEIILNEEERQLFGLSGSSSAPKTPNRPTLPATSSAGQENVPPPTQPGTSSIARENVPPSANWSNYSPAMLRTPRSNALRIPNRNAESGKMVTPKYKNNKRIYATHERLLLEKEELVDYQKMYFQRLTEIAEQEEVRKKEEHDLKMQFLRDQEERDIVLHHEKIAAIRKSYNNNC